VWIGAVNDERQMACPGRELEPADLDGLWPPSTDNRAHLPWPRQPREGPIASAHLPT
jgi:hypothetical protein